MSFLFWHQLICIQTAKYPVLMSRHGGAPHRAGSSNDPAILAAVPTLRVMRLQSPELHQPRSGTLGGQCLLHTSLCLPDSLAVYVGERFTAYLGILNASKSVAIRRLTVTAQLQTPSQRWQLPSHLDPSSAGSTSSSSSSSSSVSSAAGIDVEPESAVDAIVSHDIEESGPHILRVEVAYLLSEGGSKTFRKFYRFNVVSPLTIREHTLRWGEQACFVSLSVEFRPDPGHTDSLVISQADFVCAEGLSAQKIGTGSALSRFESNNDKKSSNALVSAVDLLDSSGLLSPDMCFRYLFKVTATTDDAVLRGIAAGDLLGKACFTWRKAMGETGRVYSEPIYCPPAHPEMSESPFSNFVMYNSGLSVDVAADSATRGALPVESSSTILSNQFPVTVEPIDPPTKMTTYLPVQVEFLVVNHSSQAMALQLQFRLSEMADHIAICGQSFKGVGEVPPNGGSRVVAMRFLPLNAGLLKVQGCHVVDMATGREIPQPPLFTTLVEEQPETGNASSPAAIVLARQ